MRKSIDILIINNVPSFYKINLYNELAKRCSIHVVFIALTNQVVINESFRDDINFSYELISDIQIERRNRFTSLLKLLGIVYHFRFKKIVYGGYDDIEQLITLFLTPKSKNCLQFESSIHETNLNGIRAKLKRIIFKRVLNCFDINICAFCDNK